MQQQVMLTKDKVMFREERPENSLQITRYSGQLYDTRSKKTIKDELAKTKEEITKAREKVMQSWLDSKPLIDNLEKQQLGLKNARIRSSMATVFIPDLEMQLETTNASIKSTKEKELEARTRIEKLGKSLELISEEMEDLKLETEREREARAKLKQELRIRRQTLRTLQLTLRAVRIESEALAASKADALHHINQSSTDDEYDPTVQLTHEEYHALRKRANEEVELGDWRVSVSMEQRQGAEESRDKALIRLKAIYSGNRRSNVDIEEGNVPELQDKGLYEMPEHENLRKKKRAHNRTLEDIMVTAKGRGPSQQVKRSRRKYKNKMVKKKKSSILHQIKSFLVRNINWLFG
ncbi:hypothetical protein IFM89_038831 [Coptis chinensis]|uniref:Uncharacterized protein n=1 Tax=Coptis chinensis TaxID=261450 RepID=A0A835HS85_9MAGN|nr:hypothetical protein IFM89_038831 [Coptis chinensis]